MDEYFDQMNQDGTNSPKIQDMNIQESNPTDFQQSVENQPQQYQQKSPAQNQNYDQFFEDQDYQQQSKPNFDNQQIQEVNKEEDILRQQEEERNKKLIELQIEESRKQEEILNNAKNWINNWRSERAQQIESKKKINRENELALIESQDKHTQYKSEWDKIIHNVELKNSESVNGKDILRMKQALLGKNSDISHSNQQ